MVRYERVAERVEHDQAEQRAKRRHEEQQRDFDASPEKASAEINEHGQPGRCYQPTIGSRVRHVDLPLWVTEREARRPKYCAEIKPDGASCDHLSFHRSEPNPDSRALMIFFPPNGEKPCTESEN